MKIPAYASGIQLSDDDIFVVSRLGQTLSLPAAGLISGIPVGTTDSAARAGVANITAAAAAGLATGLSATIIPAMVARIQTTGYASVGTGPANYNRVATQPAHPGKLQDASGAWFELNESRINVKMFGASGKVGVDSTAGVINAVLYAKYLINNLLNGTPDVNQPRGTVIYFPSGQYEITQPIPLFSRLNIRGELEWLSQGESVIKTTSTSLFTLSQNPGETPGTVSNASIFGLLLSGRSDLTTNFCDNIVYPTFLTMANCLIQNNNIQQLLPPTLYFLASKYTNNQHTRQPYGNLVMGGSDSVIVDNFFNGDDFGSLHASHDANPVVYLQNLDNSRFERNYITGASTGSTMRPLPLFMESCDENNVSDNWFDLANACALSLKSCTTSRFLNNRYCRFSLAPPTVDQAGSPVEATRYACAILLIGCTGLRFTGEEFRVFTTDPVSATTAVTFNLLDNTTLIDDITFRDEILVNHVVSFTINGTAARNARFRVSDWEGGKEIAVLSASLSAPYVMEKTYANTATTAGAIVTLPTAIVGRKFRYWQAGANSSAVGGFNIVATDVMRGQTGMTKVRIPFTDIGKYVELSCVAAGTWEILTTGTGITYAA